MTIALGIGIIVERRRPVDALPFLGARIEGATESRMLSVVAQVRLTRLPERRHQLLRLECVEAMLVCQKLLAFARTSAMEDPPVVLVQARIPVDGTETGVYPGAKPDIVEREFDPLPGSEPSVSHFQRSE